MLKRVFTTLTIFTISTPALSDGLGDIRCGTDTVGKLYAQGWRVERQDYIKSLDEGGAVILFEDRTSYRADMTLGMLVGDPAILLSKYVKSDKTEGFIYNICAGGFDAWVTPIR